MKEFHPCLAFSPLIILFGWQHIYHGTLLFIVESMFLMSYYLISGRYESLVYTSILVVNMGSIYAALKFFDIHIYVMLVIGYFLFLIAYILGKTIRGEISYNYDRLFDETGKSMFDYNLEEIPPKI